ncbi:ankyrin repeat and SOCS box protein 13 isoform X8 [Camelus ferus]|uniref:Ankyrin repeat and SOCS box protein 13 isoform X8 n=2 Tax=Camelus TaxID=9836 RepID=A0A8B8SH24_CAMFR|nr:ankyrin repeat and SOCS box protein 13 isoform X8 [Camelus ferus]
MFCKRTQTRSAHRHNVHVDTFCTQGHALHVDTSRFAQEQVSCARSHMCPEKPVAATTELDAGDRGVALARSPGSCGGRAGNYNSRRRLAPPSRQRGPGPGPGAGPGARVAGPRSWGARKPAGRMEPRGADGCFLGDVGSSECVRLLIDLGANLEAHDCHFGTPLHVACAREHLDCVKVLLNAGANVNAAKLHETALHHAAKVKNVDLIEMLIQFGGNIYARDNRGRKPSDYTRSSSAPAECFEHYESACPETPLTLSQLCRVSLRRATGVRGLEKIAKLDIPPRLIDYLSYN